MNKEYVNVSIKQTSDNGFDVHLSGNYEDLLKSLAGAVSQTIAEAPRSYQQACRNRFLQYLNLATIERHIKEK